MLNWALRFQLSHYPDFLIFSPLLFFCWNKIFEGQKPTHPDILNALTRRDECAESSKYLCVLTSPLRWRLYQKAAAPRSGHSEMPRRGKTVAPPCSTSDTYISSVAIRLPAQPTMFTKYTIRSIVCEASCHSVTRSRGHSVTRFSTLWQTNKQTDKQTNT